MVRFPRKKNHLLFLRVLSYAPFSAKELSFALRSWIKTKVSTFNFIFFNQLFMISLTAAGKEQRSLRWKYDLFVAWNVLQLQIKYGKTADVDLTFRWGITQHDITLQSFFIFYSFFNQFSICHCNKEIMYCTNRNENRNR